MTPSLLPELASSKKYAWMLSPFLHFRGLLHTCLAKDTNNFHIYLSHEHFTVLVSGNSLD